MGVSYSNPMNDEDELNKDVIGFNNKTYLLTLEQIYKERGEKSRSKESES